MIGDYLENRIVEYCVILTLNAVKGKNLGLCSDPGLERVLQATPKRAASKME